MPSRSSTAPLSRFERDPGGPVPFTPVAVAHTSATSRDIHIFLVSAGFSTDPRTGKAKPLKIVPADVGATRP